MARKILIGVAWPYANSPLHLGHISGSILPPDIFARYQRLQGKEVLMVSGSDTHGTPISVRAEQDGVPPEELAARFHQSILDSLQSLGIAVEPTGAFYVFANARHISPDSYRLAFDILEKAHVGVTPGADFGARGEGYLRFSYATSLENIAEGLSRLERYLSLLPSGTLPDPG